MRSRRPRTSKDEFVVDVETRIAGLKSRGTRNPAKLNPVVVYATIALKAIGRAIEATHDRAVRAELLQAQAILSACLALDKESARAAQREVSAARRSSPRAPPRA